jgi:Xaa-Pro aminopeptidase
MTTARSGSRPSRPFADEEYRARLRRLARRLRTARIDALIVVGHVNRLYLTGFPASNGLLLVRPAGRAEFFTDGRYLEAAERQLGFLRVGKIEAMANLLAPRARQERWRRVGYESSMSIGQFDALRAAVPRVRTWVAADKDILDLRAVKSPLEIGRLRTSVRANDAIFARILAEVRPGLTEWALRGIARRVMDEGAQGEAFDIIVAGGPNASRCHHHPGLRKLKRRDLLLLDLGCRVQDYCSDMTRVVALGPPSAKLRKIYGIVLEANRRAVAAIRPGRTGREIDAIARAHITEAGYGAQFVHGLGHGVGLEIHERPSVSVAGTEPLQAGHVVTVEPGIYLPGFGGVRIEDMVVVTPRGAEVLTRTPHDLVEIG